MHLSYVSELAQRQRHGGVVKQETAVPSLAKGLAIFQDKTDGRKEKKNNQLK